MKNDLTVPERIEIPSLPPLIAPVIGSIADYLKFKKMSEVRVAEIQARSKAAVSMLKNRRKALVSYLNCSFGEREMLFNKYFSLVEKAVDSGNDVLMQAALEGILQIYCSSPTNGLERIIS